MASRPTWNGLTDEVDGGHGKPSEEPVQSGGSRSAPELLRKIGALYDSLEACLGRGDLAGAWARCRSVDLLLAHLEQMADTIQGDKMPEQLEELIGKLRRMQGVIEEALRQGEAELRRISAALRSRRTYGGGAGREGTWLDRTG